MPRARTSAADVITVGNGVCGFLALAVLAQVWIATPGRGLSHRELVACLLLYGIGMLFDVLDGPVARRFGSSGLGSGLDAICDTITFGLLPAMLLLVRVHEDDGWTAPALIVASAYIGTTILRLARQAWLERAHAEAFARGAVDTPQPQFTGMPSPVGGNCVLAIVVLAPPPWVSVAVVALVAVLLVADYPYPNNKTIVGAGFVAALLAASFAALAGLISLNIPSAVALVGLLPIAVLRATRRLLHDH
jgi:CDP-diacylglycerol---serine O-phosphatidyltransferase